MEAPSTETQARPKNNNELAHLFARFLLSKQSFLASNIPATNQRVEATKKEILAAIYTSNYSRAILLLMRLIDEKQDIAWHITTRFLGCEVLIRDARRCSKSKIGNEPYLIMALNEVRAAIALIHPSKANKTEKARILNYIHLLICNFYLKATKLETKESVLKCFKHFNTLLITNIAYPLDISFEDAKERLTIAKDFANLEDPSKHVVTLVSLKNTKQECATVFQAELAVTQLTKNLQEEYDKRKEKGWYQALPEWQKELVEHYLPYIMLQDRIIPTQLRSILIALRNCYHTIDGAINFQDQTYLISVNVFHSGAITYLSKHKEENKRIGIFHGEQIKQVTGTDQVVLVTLNTDINPAGNDNEIVKMSNYIMKSVGGLHANLPLNAARRIAANAYHGINNIIEFVSHRVLSYLQKMLLDQDNQLAAAITDGINVCMDYLCDESELEEGEVLTYTRDFLRKSWDTFQKNLPDSPLKKDLANNIEIVELALFIRFLMNHNQSLSDADNRNLMIGCYSNLLVSVLGRYASFAVYSACESGKDRNGILIFTTALMAFNRLLLGRYILSSQEDELNKLMRENCNALAFARHHQFLAGCQGGSIGAFGIKKDSDGAIPEREITLEARQALVEETASYNKEILVLDKDPLNFIFFSFGDSTIEVQKLACSHMLLLHERNLNQCHSKPETAKFLKRLSIFVTSSNDLALQAQLMANILADIENAKSLEALLKILQAYARYPNLPKTPYGIVETGDLLDQMAKHLERVILNVNSQSQVEKVNESKAPLP